MFDPELDQIRAIEIATDQARHDHASREIRRHHGVSWAGMEGRPPPSRSEAEIEAAARIKLARRRAWERGEGAFAAAVIRCQAAARDAFSLTERARNGISRGEGEAWRRAIASELETQALALTEAAHQVLNAARAD